MATNAQEYKVGNLFEGLGIAGWGELEPCLLAAMKTRTPILLIGDRGTNKTESAYRIVRAVQGKNCNFQKYDTADSSLDDILGFPDMRKLESGEVGYIGTGTSIWNKTGVIWTEINRASPMFQGKLLEVVRTGTIHGMRTTVEFQFADCNPPRATGKSVGHDTYFMQDALAARFFCLHVPRGNAAVYKAAMELSEQRAAFDNDDTAAIGKFIAPLANLWLEYNHQSPSDDHKKQAFALINHIMLARGEGTYFDVRAAIRTTRMVEELLLLADICNRSFDINSAIARCVIGNVPELNGVLRNDRTADDMASWESDIKSAAKNSLRGLADPSKQSPAGTATRMLRDGAFDNIRINELVNIVTSAQQGPQGLTGLLHKIAVTPEMKSPNFRKGHAKAIAAVIEALRGIKNCPAYTQIAARTRFDIDPAKSAPDIGTELAQAWYAAVSSI
jgi:hypothetical protein